MFSTRKKLFKLLRDGSKREKYEYENILDRFFITLYNLDIKANEEKNIIFCIDIMEKELREKKINIKRENVEFVMGTKERESFHPERSSSLLSRSRSRSVSIPRFSSKEKKDYEELVDILKKIINQNDKKEVDTLERNSNISECVYNYMTIGTRGQQWAVPSDFFEYVYAEYNIRNEGFASPFNSFMINKKDGCYYSLFPGDSAFKSSGNLLSFLTSTPSVDKESKNDTKGNWIIDPPYTPYVLEKTVELVFKKKNDWKMIVITPTWKDATWYQQLEKITTTKEEIKNMKYQIYTGNKKGYFHPKFETTIWTIGIKKKTKDEFSNVFKKIN